jgi:hypothetical protein
MSSNVRELSEEELYEREGWGAKMDERSPMSMTMFSPGWWSNLMGTVSALGIVAVFGLLMSIRSDVNYLMHSAPYVTKQDYDRDMDRFQHELGDLETRMRHEPLPAR